MVNDFQAIAGTVAMLYFENIAHIINSICTAHGVRFDGITTVRSDTPENDQWIEVTVSIDGKTFNTWHTQVPVKSSDVIHLSLGIVMEVENGLRNGK